MVIKRLTLWVLLSGLLVCAGIWLAWQWYQSRYPTWKEEVQLSDGRVIVVEQKHEVYENYGTNQSWVTSLPEMGGERTWHSHLLPMRAMFMEEKVYEFWTPARAEAVPTLPIPKALLGELHLERQFV